MKEGYVEPIFKCYCSGLLTSASYQTVVSRKETDIILMEEVENKIRLGGSKIFATCKGGGKRFDAENSCPIPTK